MNKFSFISLWDIYNGLLTKTQQEITDLYFNLDLTVSEIAEEKKISRQAVSDCLKGCKRQLEEYEEKLGFCRKLREISFQLSFMTTDLEKKIEELKVSRPEFKEEGEKLSEILKKDYTRDIDGALSSPELYKDYTKEVYGHKKDGEE